MENSCGFVITGALTSEEAKDEAIKGIRNIMKHGDLKEYQRII